MPTKELAYLNGVDMPDVYINRETNPDSPNDEYELIVVSPSVTVDLTVSKSWLGGVASAVETATGFVAKSPSHPSMNMLLRRALPYIIDAENMGTPL